MTARRPTCAECRFFAEHGGENRYGNGNCCANPPMVVAVRTSIDRDEVQHHYPIVAADSTACQSWAGRR